MGLIINKIFLLIILILLQSCSGGRIGNFLESSFENIEEENIKEDITNNLKEKIVIKSKEIAEKSKNIEEEKIKEDITNNLKNKKSTNTEKKSKKNNKKITKKNISFQNKKFQPKSYKIIFILKDVDPKDPTENLRTILRNSDVNFEIERIERYVDPKNRSIKIN